MRTLRALIFCVTVPAALTAAAQKPAPLVIISLDGLRPDYITHADEQGTKAPTRIAAGRNLHVIDIRQPAPTFANLLHVTMPAAKMQPIIVKP
jgi:predicted AlkP superfamily pyrophosphatase or phosphodiesterase